MNFLKPFLKKKTISIKDLFYEELENFELWIPVALAIGVLTNFSYGNSHLFIISFCISCLSIIFLCRKHDYSKAIIILVLAIATGYFSAVYRIETLKYPMLKNSLSKISIKGTVEELGRTSNGNRILLRDLKIANQLNLELKNIRISTKFDTDHLRVGDKIDVFVNLMPPPKPTIFGGFNYAEYAYFKQIGAIGYTVGRIKKTGSIDDSNFTLKVNSIRDTIANRIRTNMSKRSASISEGMLIGNIGAIDKSDYEAIRIAGLAHIISISGMHIVVVVGLIFFTVKFLLSRVSFIVINYNLKKIAAVFALFASFGYLLISGSPVSAQRAFVMSAIVLLGVIIDRRTNALRAIAIAATVIIIATPETLKSAGLQMSMAASIALIVTFEKFSKLEKGLNQQSSVFKKIIRYIISITFSTLVAGLATAPFVIFHFNQFSTYSILANIAAIPLSDFFIMPVGIISILLMPFGLEHLTLAILEPGIVFLIEYSKFIALLPNANFYIPSFSDNGLALIAFGGIISALCKTQLKFFGIIMIIIGGSTCFFQPKTDVIIDGSGKVFGVVEGDAIYLSNRNKSRFAVRSWMDKLGIKERKLLKDIRDVNCNKEKCFIKKHGKEIVIFSEGEAECLAVDVVVNLTNDKVLNCDGAQIIDKDLLNNNGTHSLTITEDAINIRTAY